MEHKAWTPSELATLADVFPTGNWDLILSSLPGRSKPAIQHKAYLSGIRFNKPNTFTVESFDFDQYEDPTVPLCLNCPRPQCTYDESEDHRCRRICFYLGSDYMRIHNST